MSYVLHSTDDQDDQGYICSILPYIGSHIICIKVDRIIPNMMILGHSVGL